MGKSVTVNEVYYSKVFQKRLQDKLDKVVVSSEEIKEPIKKVEVKPMIKAETIAKIKIEENKKEKEKPKENKLVLKAVTIAKKRKEKFDLGRRKK